MHKKIAAHEKRDREPGVKRDDFADMGSSWGFSL